MSDPHRLLDAITTEVRDNTGAEALVTSYVVIASFTDPEGASSLYTETAEGQRAHETLGLLAFGTAHESARVVSGDED